MGTSQRRTSQRRASRLERSLDIELERRRGDTDVGGRGGVHQPERSPEKKHFASGVYWMDIGCSHVTFHVT